MRPRPLLPVVDRRFVFGFVLVCLTGNCTFSAEDSEEALFENSIRPVLVESCFRCHGDTKESGGLRVDSRDALLKGGDSGAAIVLRNPDESLIIKAIKRHSDISAMPPDKDKALRPDQILSFEAWVRANAPWPKLSKTFERTTHWAFEPVKTVEPPNIAGDPAENPIDAFVQNKHKSIGSSIATKATRQALIRRATFDLTGLPPTPAEVDAFEKDTSPNAYAALIDRLLESPHYGRRWGRHWLDVVRYADTAGETADYPVSQAWRYRNYVIDAFNADKPYDQFLREQIAGDILAAHGPSERYAEQVTATGYLAISRRFGFDSENYHHLTIQDTIDTLGQSVLGLSLGCARCHDHKFDDISMVDYYGLYAIFDSSRYSFPGSEQKQRVRSMVPLVPLSESIQKWREFDQQVASISSKLVKAKLPVPNAILRSLNDMDGDFEMQAPANGGSNGVLVPPWLYEGKISVTNAAQSPFKNLYASGKVGASIAAEVGKYRISQSLYPRRSVKDSDPLYVNLDFRISAADPKTSGSHRFWIGSTSHSKALSFEISADAISMAGDGLSERIGDVKPNQWCNLLLKLDLVGRTVSGTLSGSEPNAKASIVATFANKPLLSSWAGEIDLVTLESVDNGTKAGPIIEYDNLGVQREPIPPPQPGDVAEKDNTDADSIDELNLQLQTLGGMIGDFELHSEGQSPASPFNAGPNSVVKVSERSQSPFQNLAPRGNFGIYMPNRGNYDGFGLVFSKTWNAEKAEPLFACFDFRCVDIAAGDDGTWRYYLGHGPGNSAAVELFFHGKQFYRRSAEAKDPVCSLVPGDWYQVQLSIDMKSRTYSGTLQSQTKREEFCGELASGWDGAIDYSFMDSYGHIGGVRPSLDADNYVIRETPFPAFDAQPAEADIAGNETRRERAKGIRQKLVAIESSAKDSAQKLNAMLVDGPFAMAYGMAEGTPHGVPIQLRGEPSQPGNLVSRGFIKALGKESLSENTSGSGRLELANWLTRTDNPLTARVMVNRIWQYHFGQGLVKTPNDFGVRGLPPTHQDLLDYLASHFMKNRWSIKAMHRLIMHSELYQQSSRFNETQPNENPSNSEMTPFVRRRLSAEEIRDAILLVSGELDRELAQEHPFPSPLSYGFSQHGPFTAVYEHNKRSVYLMTQRLKRHPFLALFDGPDPNASTPSRLETTVPTQALYFLNDPFVYAKSEAWAKRLRESKTDDASRIEQAYRGAFSRLPTTAEKSDAVDFLATYRQELLAAGQDQVDVRALAAFARTLFGSNEFLHVD
jgi:Protein of unknown function (DUF1553)/Protein of unknown function (DUF1549)/Planctomycete cytochrome C